MWTGGEVVFQGRTWARLLISCSSSRAEGRRVASWSPSKRRRRSLVRAAASASSARHPDMRAGMELCAARISALRSHS